VIVLSQRQLDHVRAERLRELWARLAAELEAQGIATTPAAVEAHAKDSIASGLDDEEAIRIYVGCMHRLERAGFDVGRIKHRVRVDDLGRDHKLLALTMGTEEVERRALGGSDV
jgi:hypothetical protein